MACEITHSWKQPSNSRHLHNKDSEPPPPTIGDIVLEPYTEDSLQGFYQPLIYYTDGTSRPDYGAVCSNSSAEAVGTVLCRQLGYTYIESQFR
jgi:hypothetical protein